MRAALTSCVVVALVAAATPSDAAGTERRLHLAGAEASSYLVNDWNKFQENYLPLYVGDDDPVTAWTDGVDGDGVGEWLRVRVTPLKETTRVRLRVRNGYQKTPRLFTANARARQVTVVLSPSKVEKKIELADQRDWQEIVVDQPSNELNAVELRFQSVYPGSKYDDLVISDVQLYVTSTTPENPAFEKSRLEKILSWKAERLQAAKLWKSGAAKSMPVASSYVVKMDEADPERVEDFKCADPGSWFCNMSLALVQAGRDRALTRHAGALDRATALLTRESSSLLPVQAVARDRRAIPVVDGLCRRNLEICEEGGCFSSLPTPLTGHVGFLTADQISTLKIKEAPSLDELHHRKHKACRRRQPTVFTWVARGSGDTGPIRAVLFGACGLVESREGYAPSSNLQLLVYDDRGRLELLVSPEDVTAYEWQETNGAPLLARGRRVAVGFGESLTVDAAVNVARR